MVEKVFEISFQIIFMVRNDLTVPGIQNISRKQISFVF